MYCNIALFMSPTVRMRTLLTVQDDSPREGARSGAEGPHDSAESSTGLFRSRPLLPASHRDPLQLGFSEAWRMVRAADMVLVVSTSPCRTRPCHVSM